QRFEGDQRGGSASGDRLLRRAAARDSRRGRAARELGRARRRPSRPWRARPRGGGPPAQLIGAAADELADALESPFERSGDLATAVRSAAAGAERGDVVLLSPAAASYDQFEDFEERGDEFRRLVEGLR